MHDIAILAIIWLSVFVASYLAHKTRLTPVLWYLFCGAILVNTGAIPVKMPEFIHVFSELGIIVIMFALGFEEDTKNFIKGIKRSWGIAFFGAIVPFILAYTTTLMFWGDKNMAMLCGLAMTATAVSLTMVSLKTEGLHKSEAATGIMTSAILDDIASLALVAILVPIAAGEATVSLNGILFILSKAICFFIAIAVIGKWIFPSSQGFLKFLPVVGWFNLRKILSMGNGEYAVLSLLLIAVSVGLLAHFFGFHPAIGAYMAGLVIHKDYFSFHKEAHTDHFKKSRRIIDNIAFTWIGPVFFVTLGANLIFDMDLFTSVLPEALLLFVLLFVGQISSASIAARYTGKFDWPSSIMIGFGMLGRAELAFVVMNIAYVQYNIMSVDAFYTLMITAFLMNLSVPLTIRWWKSKFNNYMENMKLTN